MGRPKGSSNCTPLPSHRLLDKLREEFALPSDGHLCAKLRVSRSTLSKIRHGTNNVSADFILRVHRVTGWPIDRIEGYLWTGGRW